MRYNKHELFALASQTSQNFDREGVIILKERQDSFFRRSDGYSARWFRLRGNLLFYLKGPEPWYEPLGLIVLGNHQVSVQNQDENGHWPFQLVWENGACYRLGTFFESERTLWLKAMSSAPYEHLRQMIVDLQRQLNDTRTMIDLKKYRSMNKIIHDFNEVPLCELSLSCDNLLCDANGNPPSPFAAVFAVFSEEGVCVRYGSTEVVEKCSNPNFMRTVMFRMSDGITADMMIRIVIYNMREIVTQTGVPIGSVSMRLSHIQEAQRFRAPLMTTENKVVGFVTFNGWSLERAPSATIPTAKPNPEAQSATSPTLIPNPEKNSIDLTPKLPAHRRSQSLPPRIGLKFNYPEFSMIIHENFLNPHQATYHFHSGLGGDIIVQEALAEPIFSFTLALQLLEIFIAREEELVDAMLGFAEAAVHVNLHMTMIKELKTARDNMLSHSVCFKPSVQKISEITEEPALAYAPVNLHLQRLSINNDSLNKKGMYDTITVGAFTAHSQTTAKPGGLIRLLKQSKDVSTRKAEMTANSNRLEAEFEKLRAMKSLHKIVMAHMNSMLMLLKHELFLDTRKSMAAIRENVKMIFDLWDAVAIEEALFKIGWEKSRLNMEEWKRKRAEDLVLRARLMEPGGNAHRAACAAAAIATVAALSAPTTVDRAGETSVEAIVRGMDRNRTAAGGAAGSPVRLHPASPKTDDGAKAVAKLAVTTTDAAKLAPANADRAVVFAVFRTRSGSNLRRTLGPTPAASRSLSESDLRNTSEHNLVNNNHSPKCDKNGKNTEHGVEATFTSTRHANAAGTSGDSAPEKVESTSDSTAAARIEEQVTAISQMIDEELAASSSGLSAAGTSGSTASVQNASRPHTSGKSKRGKPRGCKNNRAPKLTKQDRKEANRESLRLTPGGQARMAETANRRADFNSATSLDNVTLGSLVSSNIGCTKKTKRNRREPALVTPDPAARARNLNLLNEVTETVNEMMNRLFVKINTITLKGYFTDFEFEDTRITMELLTDHLEDAQGWTRLAHSAMRINTEPPAWRSEYTMLRTRRDICFSQALTAAAAGVLCWATTTPVEIVAKIVQSGLGPLLGFEGLLSLHAEETTMWGDMVIAVEDLHTLIFKFVTVSPSGPFVPQVTGSRSALVIEIPVTYNVYYEFHNAAVPPTFAVTPVFFNIGINDKAFTAESLGDNKPQYQSNKDNFEKLFKYYHKYCKKFPQDPYEQFKASSRSKPLEEVMENLRAAVQRRTLKNVEVLQLAAEATRLMHGVRFTSCKSAKDRTGMAVTLEQANILSNEYHLADDERKLALDVMRSEGVRRENTEKNTGQRKYAFSKPQVMALPEEYRPPLGSYGAIERGSNR